MLDVFVIRCGLSIEYFIFPLDFYKKQPVIPLDFYKKQLIIPFDFYKTIA